MSTIPIEFPEESTGSDEPVVLNVPQEVDEPHEPVEEVYSILEKGPYPQLDIQDPSEVLSLHESLLRARISSCLHFEEGEEMKTENLAATYFSGTSPDEEGISMYGKGISMSLWDVNGKLALVATSNRVSLVGGIKKVDSKMDMLHYELSFGSAHSPSSPWIEISHSANQDVEKLLRDWTALHKAKKTEKALEKYYRLIDFRIDAVQADARWSWVWKLKSPLLFLTHCALRQYYNKKVSFEKNDLIMWMGENVVIPKFNSGD